MTEGRSFNPAARRRPNLLCACQELAAKLGSCLSHSEFHVSLGVPQSGVRIQVRSQDAGFQNTSRRPLPASEIRIRNGNVTKLPIYMIPGDIPALLQGLRRAARPTPPTRLPGRGVRPALASLPRTHRLKTPWAMNLFGIRVSGFGRSRPPWIRAEAQRAIVLERVQRRTALARLGARPGRLLGVRPVDGDSLRCELEPLLGLIASLQS